MQEVKTGKSKKMPEKIVLYGVPKIGKSRFCAQFDDVFFLDIEGGLNYLGKEVRATPRLLSYDDVIAWLSHIHKDDTFKAGIIALDSLDWLESLAIAKVEKENGGVPITNKEHKAYAYGNGTLMVDRLTTAILKWLDAIYTKRGIPAIIIAHSKVQTIDLPTKEPYSRHEMKVSKGLSARATEWGDLILFADYSFHINKEGKTSEPKPTLFAGGSAAFVGGGRMSLSKEIPLDLNALRDEIIGKKP